MEVSGAARRPRRTKVIRPPRFSLGGLLADLRNLADYRDLFITLTIHRINVRYKQSMLGLAWAIVNPLSLMLVYTLVFSRVAKMPSEELPYAAFVYSALLPWTFFSASVVNAASGMISHANLITKVYFPREILPLTYVFAALFDLLAAFVVMAGLMGYYRIAPTWQLLWAIPILAIAVVFATSLSFLFSVTQARFRDVAIVMPLVLQLWLFATPVVYPLSRVPSSLRPWYVLNPMTAVVESFRVVVLLGKPPDLELLAMSAAITGVLAPLTYLYFKQREAGMADVI